MVLLEIFYWMASNTLTKMFQALQTEHQQLIETNLNTIKESRHQDLERAAAMEDREVAIQEEQDAHAAAVNGKVFEVVLHPPSRESKPKGTSYISCLPPPLPVGYTVLSLSIATHIVSVDTTGTQFHYPLVRWNDYCKQVTHKPFVRGIPKIKKDCILILSCMVVI